MRIVILILSIFVLIKTFSYGIYEYKNENKVGGIIIDIIAIISSIVPNILIHIR